MTKKFCDCCGNGTEPVALVFADDETFEVFWAEYCPICGRHIE